MLGRVCKLLVLAIRTDDAACACAFGGVVSSLSNESIVTA